jgi:TPP-dependent pyruvate/acetoin dehydrogenase alpha subunit
MESLILKRIFERAALCRAFEEECARRIESKDIKFPTYLSVGQEYVPATVSVWLEDQGITDRQIFIQHRGHSQYLCFDGDIDALVLELLGDPRGCANGMGGSASIQSIPANIYGHDGMLGSQVPIAVGACYANRKPTICFAGDAAMEEDYALAALGWAGTHKLPILFVIEDNNLSVLTEKRVRRSWDVVDVARGFELNSGHSSDDPDTLYSGIPELGYWPALININTTRLRWHAGAGVDDPNAFDRHFEVSMCFDKEYRVRVIQQAESIVREAWQNSSAS